MHKIDPEYLKELTAVISVDCESLNEVVQHATSSTVFKEKISHPKVKTKQTQLSYNCDLLFHKESHHTREEEWVDFI